MARRFSERMDLRLAPAQVLQIAKAARRLGISVNEFVRRSAMAQCHELSARKQDEQEQVDTTRAALG